MEKEWSGKGTGKEMQTPERQSKQGFGYDTKGIKEETT